MKASPVDINTYHASSSLYAHQVAGGGKSAKAVSYPFFIACISLLDNMELVKLIYLSATKGSKTSELTKGGTRVGCGNIVVRTSDSPLRDPGLESS